MIKKFVYRCTIFIILLLFIIYNLESVLILKTDHGTKLYQGLYSNIKEQYDVVLLGSSHMNGAINPNVLWNEYGITSFNYATGGQPIDVTYYLLKEVLKKQKNPIVVIDLYYIGLTLNYGEEGYIRYVLDNMRPSLNKLSAILNCTPRPHWMSYIFPIIKYHSRWKELTQQDFYKDLYSTYYAKGFNAEYIMHGKDTTSDIKTKEISDIPKKSKEYLYKIIELSKKKGFKLIFINAPYDYNITNGTLRWHEEANKMFNMVDKIAKENDIPFINYNNILDEIGFNFKTDMANAGHLNIYGADKVSAHLGRFIKEKYNLPDKRKDEKFKNWNYDYEVYYQNRLSVELRKELDFEKLVKMLSNKNYVVAISSDDSIFEFEYSLKELGLKYEKGKNYIAVINGGKIAYELCSNDNIDKNFIIDNVDIKINSSNNKNPSIIINGKEYAKDYKGLNIVVYDKLLNKVVDNMFFEGSELKKNRI